MMVTSFSERDFQQMRRGGVTLPTNPIRARIEASAMADGLRSGAMASNVASAARSRADSYKTAGSSFQLGFPTNQDPTSYWQDKKHWYDPDDDSQDKHKDVVKWSRLMYATHHLIPSLIDIYTRFPILGIEFAHKDGRLADFYNDLFLDQLGYQEHLYDVGREFWIAGECFSLGSWHDGIGMWDDDQIINPMDVTVESNRLLKIESFRVALPEDIRRVVETGKPEDQFILLQEMYGNTFNALRRGDDIEVSDVLMKHLKFKASPWDPRGTPILLRAFRQILQEESLMSAQDAIADRLYSPLILAKLGLDNLDDNGAWIPDESEIGMLRNDLNVALTAKFRLMVHHHGLDIQNVFGREQMPNLDSDFDRIEQKIMGVFGIGEDLLRGGSSNATYASGALNRELITQLLETYQVALKKFVRDRCAAVAERQGHYEYEKKGDRRVPIMEFVLVVDEETGEEYVEERPKLAVPELNFKAMNLRDESVERNFLMELKNNGWPVSDRTLAMNLDIEFDAETETEAEEFITKNLEKAKAKRKLFEALRRGVLPPPSDLAGEYEAWLAAWDEANAAPEPEGDLGAESDLEDFGGPSGGGGFGGGGGGANSPVDTAIPDDFDPMDDLGPEMAPDISTEQMGDMPRPASRITYSEIDKLDTPVGLRKRRRMTMPRHAKLDIEDDSV